LISAFYPEAISAGSPLVAKGMMRMVTDLEKHLSRKGQAMSGTWSKIAAIAFVFAVSGANAESNKRIDLHCYFEGTAYSDRFEGMYSRTSGTTEEGTGTWKIEADGGRITEAIFRLDKGSDGKWPGALLIYPEPRSERDTKISLERIIFRVDKQVVQSADPSEPRQRTSNL
jgi:hypothetical protein